MKVSRLGSENRDTTFFDTVDGVFVECGCFYGTLAEFKTQVVKTHGEGKHAKTYLLAAQMAEIQFEVTT